MERYPGPSVSETTIDYYYRPAVGRSVREDDFLPVEGQGRVSLEAGHQTAGAFAQAQVPYFGRADLALSDSVNAAYKSSAPGVYVYKEGNEIDKSMSRYAWYSG